MRNAFLAFALAAIALGASAGTALGWDPAGFSPADEQLLFSLTNQDRASAGLNALVDDGYLHKEAEWRAQDMGDNNYFSHSIPPSGLKVFDYMSQDGYCYTYAGENIGLSTYDDSIATNRIETAFMGSTAHRENILGTWAHLGVGAYKAADGRKLYAVLFSIPCGVTVPTPTPVVTPPPAPTPVPTAAPVGTQTPHPQGTPAPVQTNAPRPSGAAGSQTSAAPSASGSPSSSAGATGAAAPESGSSGSSSSTPGPGSSDTPAPAGGGTTPAPAQPSTLRVQQETGSQGPIESFFNALFGGIFGL
jgi:uncharacterized protein YkwD